MLEHPRVMYYSCSSKGILSFGIVVTVYQDLRYWSFLLVSLKLICKKTILEKNIFRKYYFGF